MDGGSRVVYLLQQKSAIVMVMTIRGLTAKAMTKRETVQIIFVPCSLSPACRLDSSRSDGDSMKNRWMNVVGGVDPLLLLFTEWGSARVVVNMATVADTPPSPNPSLALALSLLTSFVGNT